MMVFMHPMMMVFMHARMVFMHASATMMMVFMHASAINLVLQIMCGVYKLGIIHGII